VAAGSGVLTHARPVRVLVAKVGLDGHDVGARVVARGLMDAGMEVIYTGLRRTPEQVVAAALQEDCEVIGISILSGAHTPLVRRIQALMLEAGLDDVLLLVGGVIPEADVATLREIGVDAVFHPATKIEEIAQFITEHRPVRGSEGQ
jgi:methylmalonyl-CoA mutase cobalamin-binding domain/chain